MQLQLANTWLLLFRNNNILSVYRLSGLSLIFFLTAVLRQQILDQLLRSKIYYSTCHPRKESGQKIIAVWLYLCNRK